MHKLVSMVLMMVLSCTLAQAQRHPHDGGGSPPPPQLPAPTVLTDTIYCVTPTVQAQSVSGATRYEFWVDGSPVSSFAVEVLSTHRLYFLPAPGETHIYQYRALVSGVWTGLSDGRMFYLDCGLFPLLFQGDALTSLFKFPDVSDEPVTPSEATTLVYTTMREWIEEASYGVATITGPPAVGWFTMPQPITYYCPSGPNELGNWFGCDYVRLRDDSGAVLAAAGHNLSLYPGYNARIFSHIQFAAGDVIGTSLFSLNTLVHEWGHGVAGLFHAGSWTCNSGADTGPSLTNPLAGECFILRYTGREPMGVTAEQDTFSAFNQEALRWIASNEWLYADYCGEQTYTLKALTSIVAPREIRVEIPGMPFWFYSLEYRPATGVRVWLHPHGSGIANQNGWSDGSLYQVNNGIPGNNDVTPTNPFTDTYRGISVEVLSMGAQEVTVRVTRTVCE